jgi:recombinational DNA repair ATPase RecF
LLDDALSELDPEVQARVLAHVAEAGQVFLTTADASIPDVARVTWWEVSEGRVTQPRASTIRGAA